MIRVSANKLVTNNIGYKAAFQEGRVDAAKESTYTRVATVVPSTTREEEYGWLKDIPQIREWIGDRQINALADDGYKIKNKPFELTVGVNADDINDDRVGIYAPKFKFMGDEVERFPNRMVYSLLKAGTVSKCYDGQPFFDANHPYTKADRTAGVQSNLVAGAGVPWFILSTKRPLKPLIYQERQKFEYVELTKPDDPNVFMRKELLYGVDGRANAGFGFWQMAVCSKAALDAASYKAARKMMRQFKGEFDKPLGQSPDLFVAGTEHEDMAEELFMTETLAAGGKNPLYKKVDVLITEYLDV